MVKKHGGAVDIWRVNIAPGKRLLVGRYRSSSPRCHSLQKMWIFTSSRKYDTGVSRSRCPGRTRLHWIVTCLCNITSTKELAFKHRCSAGSRRNNLANPRASITMPAVPPGMASFPSVLTLSVLVHVWRRYDAQYSVTIFRSHRSYRACKRAIVFEAIMGGQ